MTDRNDSNRSDSTDSKEFETDADQLQATNVTHVTLNFRPEEWVERGYDEYAEQAMETIQYVVPVEAVLDDNGMLIDEHTYEMDNLQAHENAPDVVKTWSGPFTLSYNEFHNSSNDQLPLDVAVAVVTFHPEIPVDGELVVPDDAWSFTIPAKETLTPDGNDIVTDDTGASDALARSDHAPEIVRRWNELTLTDWYYRISIDQFRVGDEEFSVNEFLEQYVRGDNNA